MRLDPARQPVVIRCLERSVGDVPDRDRRIRDLYLPVLSFSVSRLDAAAPRPAVIGLQAPQGAGKTTLATHVLACLPDLGLRGVSVSIDDFYLTRTEQLRLAAAHPGNPYLEHRGYPGTHDVPLGERTIAALRTLGDSQAASVPVPAYDKSAHGGRGDRRPEADWPVVTGPLDLVIVEGWMLGFTPVEESRLPDSHLVTPNRALADYARWHRQIDAWVVLRALDPAYVLRWRVEAEENMKKADRPGLSREAIEDYVRRFLPAYRLYGGAPRGIGPDAVLTLWLDEVRRVVAPAHPDSGFAIPDQIPDSTP
jgi:D-glycerate 3-kinase